MTTVAGPIPIRSNGPAPNKPAPAVTRKLTTRAPIAICPRLVIYGVEGWGKTTLGAFAPEPVILMARDERGVDRLLSAGRIPNVPAERIESWPDALEWLDALAVDPQGRKTMVLDAAGGFERLCHEFVCNRDYGGIWGKEGFDSFKEGYDVSVAEWLKMLQRLDTLNRAGMTVMLLGHAKVKSFKNPVGPDFDRYECDIHHKTWAVTARWADAVLFGNFQTIVEIAGKKTGNIAKDKGKGIGGTQRTIFTERRDAFDAKNGYGMSPSLALPSQHDQGWPAVWTEITKNQA